MAPMSPVWISTVPVGEATGRLKEAYDWQSARLGRPTEFTMIGSLDPEIVHARLGLYRASERCPSALTPRQRTVIGYVTSMLNSTPHCASQVRGKLREVGFTEEEIRAMDERRYDALAPEEAAVARYSDRLTLEPGAVGQADVQDLRANGLGDLEILDANNMCAHLNYVNRIANGLGLRSEVDAGFQAFEAIPQ
ncbi:MAG: carboxymuconolactone decarboxylase family protein [Actinomycetota bacterium]